MQGRIRPLTFDFDGNTLVTFETRDRREAEQMAEKLMDKPVTATFKKTVKHRSLDQNAYMWQLLQKIAEVLQSDKELIYKQMLRRYGQFITIKANADDVDRILKEFTADIIDREWQTDMYYVNLYIGSSQYDTKQMTSLLDGVINEAKELGIETMTPAELELLKC